MTIIHISTPLSWRGGEQQLIYLAAELQKKGIDQIVICPQNSVLQNRCKSFELKHIAYRKKGFLNLALAKKIRKVSAQVSQPIIHTHDSHGHTAAFIAAALLGNDAPIVVSRRVDFPIKKSVFSKWKYNHRAICRIICVSNAIKEITAPDIRCKNKLVTIHSGIDLGRFESNAATNMLRKTYNVPDNNILIGNIAALADHKDYFTFVDTAKILKEQGRPYTFVIIGEGPMKSEISNYIEENGMQQHIIMTGFLKNIPEILPELDIFLITSKTEGLGTSVLDAFACKVPVVATKGGGIPEMVVHRETGMLAEVKDAQSLAENINELIEYRDLKDKIIKQASEKLKKFTKESTAEKTLEIYQSIY